MRFCQAIPIVVFIGIVSCNDGEPTKALYEPQASSSSVGGGGAGDASTDSGGDTGAGAAFGTGAIYHHDASTCLTCSQLLKDIGSQYLLCTKNGSPSSADLYDQYIYVCGCQYCFSDCEPTCDVGASLLSSPTCKTCRQQHCASQLAACQADVPGGGGAGGGGGTGGSASDAAAEANTEAGSVDASPD